MAKRRINKESGPELPGGRTTGDTITAFADDLGKLLGTATAKAEGWLGQRTQIDTGKYPRYRLEALG